MATKADFTPEEWDLLRQAPMLAGMGVTIADPSNPVGMVQEAMAMANSVRDAVTQFTDAPLLKELFGNVDEMRTDNPMEGLREQMKAAGVDKSPALMTDWIVGRVKSAADLLNQKAADDADEFNHWLVAVAQKVAQAAREGGFLGIGGQPVSDEERAYISKLAGALGVTLLQ